MTEAERTREQRVRRAARRQGLQLVKSRTRDPRALDYARYALDSMITPNRRVWGYGQLGRPGATLDEIEDYLNRKAARE
jgi:hypothetical protein